MLSKRYEVDRRALLHVPSGTLVEQQGRRYIAIVADTA